MTLVEFLLARIAEDEAVARFCAAGVGARWRLVENGQTMVEDETGSEVIHYDGARNLSDVNHIARHDPARVLRECEAKRRIVADCSGRLMDAGADGSTEVRWVAQFAEETLWSLAFPYADHEDFDPAWAAG